MNWFNWYGTVIVAILMIPNLLFFMKQKEGAQSDYRNKPLEVMEQIGRIGSILLMMLQIPWVCLGFWFPGGLMAYCIGNGLLLAAYCVLWGICWNRYPRLRALSLSVLPSILFLWSGIVTANFPLLAAALLFAPCHIFISWKSATGRQPRNKGGTP